MAFEVLEAPVERDAQGAGGEAGPILRVGIPTTGGRILKAAKDAGYSVLFSTNAFMVRDGVGDVVSVRRPDPKQFAGLDAALDSAGFVAMAKYRGFPWTIEQYLDLVESWPWSWYASWDQCVEPEIASSKIDVFFRLAETCRLLSEVRMRLGCGSATIGIFARAKRNPGDRGGARPRPAVWGWPAPVRSEGDGPALPQRPSTHLQCRLDGLGLRGPSPGADRPDGGQADRRDACLGAQERLAAGTAKGAVRTSAVRRTQ